MEGHLTWTQGIGCSSQAAAATACQEELKDHYAAHALGPQLFLLHTTTRKCRDGGCRVPTCQEAAAQGLEPVWEPGT